MNIHQPTSAPTGADEMPRRDHDIASTALTEEAKLNASMNADPTDCPDCANCARLEKYRDAVIAFNLALIAYNAALRAFNATAAEHNDGAS